MAGILGLYTMLKIFFSNGINKKILYHPITLILIIEVIWMLITALLSDSMGVALKRVAVRTCYLSVYYFLFLEAFKKRENIKKVYWIYLAGFAIPLLYTLYIHAQWDFTSQGAILACRPFYNDHTIYGAVIALLIPFIMYTLYKKYTFPLAQLLLSVLLILFGTALFFSYSRAAWISLLVAFIFYILIRLKISLGVMLVILFLIAAVAYQQQSAIYEILIRSNAISNKNEVSQHLQSVTNISSDLSNAERINRWKCAWRMFEDKPVTGFGPGTYQFYYGQYQVRTDMTRISTFEGNRGHAHSEYLNYLSETGLPGLTFFLVLIFISIKTGLKLIYQSTDEDDKYTVTFILSGLITFYVHELFNGFIEIDKMAVLILCGLAAITSIDISSDYGKKKKNQDL